MEMEGIATELQGRTKSPEDRVKNHRKSLPRNKIKPQ